MTIKEVSEITNISVRNLQYYSDEGIVVPERGKYDYRNYSDLDVQRLQQVKIFKSLGMRLKEIKEIMNADDYDMKSVFRNQIAMLEEKREEINRSIAFAKATLIAGIDSVNPYIVDNLQSIDFERDFPSGTELSMMLRKMDSLDDETLTEMRNRVRSIFQRFGDLRGADPGAEEVQDNVDALIGCISEYLDECSPGLLIVLQQILQGNGSAAELVDKIGGEGTAKLVAGAVWIRSVMRITIDIMWTIEQFMPLRGRLLTDPDVKSTAERVTAILEGYYGINLNSDVSRVTINKALDVMLERMVEPSDEKDALRFVKEVFNYYGGTDNDQ